MITATVEGGPQDGKIYTLRNNDTVVFAEMEPITKDYWNTENAMQEVGFKKRHIRPTHKIARLVDWDIDHNGCWVPPLYVGYYALVWEDGWIG